MKSSSKQRIIGAFVLCALALIFFPVLFDLSVDKPVDTSETIPPMPEITPIVIDDPKPVADIIPPKEDLFIPPVVEDQQAEPDIAPEAEPESATKSEKPVEPEQPKLTEQGLVQAWLIQVASFSEKAKAEALNTKLKKSDFKSYVQQGLADKKVIYRVFVGPKIRKSDALDEQKQIEKQYQLKTIIREFKP